MGVRLADLDPRWGQVGTRNGQVTNRISFLCPHCRKQRLVVKFEPHVGIDPGGYWSEQGEREDAETKVWHRSGDTFDTITLTPSVDAFHLGHWHGNIINGECVGGDQCQ